MDKIERKCYYKDYSDDILEKVDELVVGYNELIKLIKSARWVDANDCDDNTMGAD